MARTVTVELVDARNAFNALANEVEAHLLRIVNEWQDRKIYKISGYGGLTAGFKSVVDSYCASHGYNLPRVDDGPVCRVWLNVYCQHGCIMAMLRDLPNSLKVELYLGRVDDAGVVNSLSTPCKRQTAHTVENVNNTIQRAVELESEARFLRSSVSDFF